MNVPYPKPVVHFVAEHLPECVSLWCTLWDRANNDCVLLLSRDEVRNDLCLSYTIMRNQLRRLARCGVVDFQELNEKTLRVEMVEGGMFEDEGA